MFFSEAFCSSAELIGAGKNYNDGSFFCKKCSLPSG